LINISCNDVKSVTLLALSHIVAGHIQSVLPKEIVILILHAYRFLHQKGVLNLICYTKQSEFILGTKCVWLRR